MNYHVDDSAIYLIDNLCADRNPRRLIGRNVAFLCLDCFHLVVKFDWWLAIHPTLVFHRTEFQNWLSFSSKGKANII